MPSSSVTGGFSPRTSKTVKRRNFCGSSAVTFPWTITLPSCLVQSTGLLSFQSDSMWNSAPPVNSSAHWSVYSRLVIAFQTFEAGALISIVLFTNSFSIVFIIPNSQKPLLRMLEQRAQHRHHRSHRRNPFRESKKFVDAHANQKHHKGFVDLGGIASWHHFSHVLPLILYCFRQK